MSTKNKIKVSTKNLLILLTCALFSCMSNNKESEEVQRRKIWESNKASVISKLITYYEIKYQWDTLSYKYSVSYKPVISSNYQLIDDFEINDIYEKDSSLFISISTNYYPTFYFDFSISEDQEKLFTNSDNDLIMVVNIEEIKKMKLVPEAEMSDDFPSIYFSSSNDFIGSGKLVKIESLTLFQ
jgi:hypothetical protein